MIRFMVTRVAALLEIEVAAQPVDQDQVLADDRVQGRDREVQAQAVRTPLLPVGDAALEVLERAGHPGLAMALEHRHIDQVIQLQNLLADGDLHPAA
jgi:hypothetical protein